MITILKVIVGILTNSQSQLLIAQRQSHQYAPGLWEFPGGKIESNETSFAALQRELREEIAIEVLTAEPWFQIQHAYPDRTVLLDIWRVIDFAGEAKGSEGQLIRWISVSQLDQFQFPEGNKEILRRLSE